MALAGLIFLLATRRFSSFLLLTLNLVLVIDCATFVMFEYYFEGDRSLFGWSLSINSTFDLSAHTIVMFAYSKVILELNALMDKEVILSNS
jgi:hypothetical protein